MRTAVLWTGGKDSALALHRFAQGCSDGPGTHAGPKATVTDLVTFVPPDAHFHAHDLGLMAAQAESLGIPHRRVVIEEPYDAGYQRALAQLRRDGIERVVTGDIAPVDGHPNFIAASAKRAGMAVELPLWGVDRRAHVAEIIALGFDVIFTFVNDPWFDASWVGRHLDAHALRDLDVLSQTRGLDVAGENGEYHSMVLGGPGFRRPIQVEGRTLSSPPRHRFEVLRHS